MRDLTDRVLDTATALGATYADVRVVQREDESISVKSGRVEGGTPSRHAGRPVAVAMREERAPSRPRRRDNAAA